MTYHYKLMTATKQEVHTDGKSCVAYIPVGRDLASTVVDAMNAMSFMKATIVEERPWVVRVVCDSGRVPAVDGVVQGIRQEMHDREREKREAEEAARYNSPEAIQERAQEAIEAAKMTKAQERFIRRLIAEDTGMASNIGLQVDSDLSGWTKKKASETIDLLKDGF